MPTKDYDDSWEINELASIPIPFTSTTGNIVGISFAPNKEEPIIGTLYVTFKDGKYKYDDVPLETAFGFAGASSATLYLNDQIKDVFSYEEI
jgi:KTSC domain-containing protein